MKEKLGRFLQQEGYFPTTSSLPEFSVYFLPCNENAEVIVLVDYQKEIYLTKEIFGSIKENFIRSFKENGFLNVHILTMVLNKESERIEGVFGQDSFSWYIDVDNEKLLIPDSHVEDFYGLKKKIDKFLAEPYLYIEETIEKNKTVTRRSFHQLPYMNAGIVLINIIG